MNSYSIAGDMTLKSAARALNRLMADSSILNQPNYGYGFDCGEFSDGYHAEWLSREQDRLTELVARRFGVTPDEVWYKQMDFAHFVPEGWNWFEWANRGNAPYVQEVADF